MNIVAVKSIGVVVEQAENGSRPDEVGNEKTRLSGADGNAQYCH